MSVKIRCPACRAVHSVHRRVLGKTIKCPDCTAEIQVPSAEQLEEAKKAKTAVAFPGLEKLPPTPAPKPGSKSPSVASVTSSTPRAVASAVAKAPAGSAAASAVSADALEKELAQALTSFRRPKQPPADDMDMTPMVDVTFLLLIFFMITASFAVQKSIQRPTQKSDTPSTVQQIDQDKDAMIIQVDEFNAYNVIIGGVDTVAGSKQDLIVKLKDFQAGTNAGERPTKLIVDAHENCIHSAVVDALDAGREAGFENFEVRTVEQFD